MATWKSYRVADLITEIEEDKYILPVIQRRLVWEEDNFINFTKERTILILKKIVEYNI